MARMHKPQVRKNPSVLSEAKQQWIAGAIFVHEMQAKPPKAGDHLRSTVVQFLKENADGMGAWFLLANGREGFLRYPKGIV